MVVENYRPDVKHRLGVDYEACRAVNPRIIYGSISGFGQDGPYAPRPGVDQIAQGLGGIMSVNGLPGGGPVRVGIPIADLTAGGFLAQAILLALYERERSGEGQWVHTSLLEAQLAMLDLQATRWLIDSETPPQAGNDHPTLMPTGVYENGRRPDQHRRLRRSDLRPPLPRDRRSAADRSPRLRQLRAALAQPRGAERSDRPPHPPALQR